MKKAILFATVMVVVSAICSCSKTCTCVEKTTGVSQKISTDQTYRECADIQDLLNKTAYDTETQMGVAHTQKWTCN